MNSATSQSFIDEATSLPVARIDAQEEEYTAPLREYLETNGCQVFVNQQSQQSVAYHIAAGDVGFVKGIFSAPSNSEIRRLGLMIDSSPSAAENLVDGQTKIVVVDPTHLGPVDVVEIFSFFFTAKNNFLDKRRNRHEPFASDHPEEKAPVVENVQPVLPEEDRQRIGNIISDVFGQESKHSGEPAIEKTHKRRRKKIKTSAWVTVASAIIIFLLPVVWYGVSLTAAATAFTFGGLRMKNGDPTRAERIVDIGQYWLYQSKFAFRVVSAPLTFVGFSHFVRGQERLLSFLSDVSNAFDEIKKIVQLERDVASLLLTSHKERGSPTPAPEIERLRMSVASVQSSLGLAQAQLGSLLRDATFPFFLPPAIDLGLRGQKALDYLRGILTYVDQVLTLYPHVAGFKEPKTYLVLMQNSNELRPTGGFIGSVGVAKFEEGYLSDFTISDVYALDGQLKGHVDPPMPIRELLGSEHWYLRDSNWDPDFQVSAERAIWFYEKETGGFVDGVIAVNVPVVIDILKATGPILLSDYNDRITAENFFGKSIFYTQTNTFPGSTQKSDFLGTLTRALMTKITTEKDVNPVTLFRAFAAGLGRRDILFMFTDDNLQQLVDHFGWSGRVFGKNGCEGTPLESCLFDPVAIVEANLSVSKVNYFMKRTSTREVIVAPDGSVSEHLTMSLRNTVNLTADANARGIGGPYITYMRFLVPSESLIADITLDGTPVGPRDPKSKGPPVLPYRENTDGPAGTRGIGVAFDVPPGVEKRVKISYKRGSVLPFGRGGAVLDLLWYKHPGVSDNVAKTIIRYPIFWIASDESPGERLSFLAKDGELEYNTTILQDQFVRIKFTK